MRRHHLLVVITCCAARALAPLRSRSLLSLRGGGDDDGDAAGAPPSAAPPPPRGPVDAVHLRLLSTGRGRWLAGPARPSLYEIGRVVLSLNPLCFSVIVLFMTVPAGERERERDR